MGAYLSRACAERLGFEIGQEHLGTKLGSNCRCEGCAAGKRLVNAERCGSDGGWCPDVDRDALMEAVLAECKEAK